MEAADQSSLDLQQSGRPSFLHSTIAVSSVHNMRSCIAALKSEEKPVAAGPRCRFASSTRQ